MKAAIIGGGVIGAGWAARFVLHGWDVALVDNDPHAPAKVEQVLAAARASLPQLYARPLPAAGHLTFSDNLNNALDSADWVQENVPEDIGLKRRVLADVLEHLGPAVPLASSTSGFTPAALSEGLSRPEQVLVCHPFNPVYLLPLVEVVPGAHTPGDVVERAERTLRGIGMQPVRIRREVDGHVADRLLEALWREALWLVHDGVATTEEIDDVIRFGFGPRWAQMGLFETYRIAGGEGGMRRFLEHFGPALHWPWSKLTDVPDLTPALIEAIAAQSDAQSGHMTIGELEAQRDRNLVALFSALKQTDYGVGRLLNDLDAAGDD